MSRAMWWVAGVLGALLVATVVLVSALLVTMNRQAEREAWQACMTSQGVAPGAAATADEAATAAAACDRMLN